MCGRYALILPPEAVKAFFKYAEQPNFPPRYNIAPTQPVPVVVERDGSACFTLMRWGFLPAWVKDPKEFPLVINVRGETIAEKPSFRAAFTRRRCLMPADGFYEWHRVGKDTKAYLFRRPDRGVFAFAAIHETWSSADGSEIDTVALVNSHANGLMSAIHHRCPVILEPAQFEPWLDPATTREKAELMLKPPPDDALELIRIGSLVNKVGNDGPDLHLPSAELPEAVAGDKPAGAPRVPKTKPPRTEQGSLF
jgi:putative SOS response-associated peptidase YedK